LQTNIILHLWSVLPAAAFFLRYLGFLILVHLTKLVISAASLQLLEKSLYYFAPASEKDLGLITASVSQEGTLGAGEDLLCLRTSE
jgi:hypothetical protein